MADRLVATLVEHRVQIISSGSWFLLACACGERFSADFTLGYEMHAEHLALIVRRHLRTTPVITAVPFDGDRRTYEPPAEIPGS